MKYLSFLLLTVIFIISSCTKTIDLNLDEDEQRTVINSKLLLGTHNFEVNLSKSGNYFGTGSINHITNATVSLFDGVETYDLTNQGNGVYQLADFTTSEYQDYKLTVEENGATHEASAKMVSVVTLDTLYFEYVEAVFGDEESGYQVLVDYLDPVDIHNYYMLETRVNGELDFDDFVVFDDEFINGNRLIFPVERELSINDTIQVDLISINEETYHYFTQLQLAIDGGGAAPANPDNNFGKEVLGNFSVIAVSSRTAIVQ